MSSIVITDFIDFSDEHLARLRKLGKLVVHSDLPNSEDELIARLSGHDIAVVGFAELPERVLTASSQLKLISLWAAGFDHVDLNTSQKLSIPVAAAVGYASRSVAEFTIGLMLSLTRRLPLASSAVSQGEFDWQPFRGNDLSSLTIGVIGCGAIGQEVLNLCSIFGSKLLCNTRSTKQEFSEHKNLTFVELDELLASSDIVSLHIPLDDSTQGLLDKKRLSLMKKRAILINTSRGKMVDEAALLDLIASDHLGGAAIDTFSENPPKLAREWFDRKNVILTPHIAFNTNQALEVKGELCVSNIENFLKGMPSNIINGVTIA